MFPKNRQYSLVSLPARLKNQVPQVVGSMVLHIGLLLSTASREIQLIVKSFRLKHCNFCLKSWKTLHPWSVVAQVNITLWGRVSFYQFKVVNNTTLCARSISGRINKNKAELTELSMIKRLISIFSPSFCYQLSIVDTDAINTFLRL